jgi:hypothetical protein
MSDPEYDVDRTVDQLRAALADHGITLPSLGVDLPAFACEYAWPLVALGNCNLATAHKLTAVLRKAPGQ